MFRVTVKNLLAHKLRLVLSGLAVVLGVAFVAGTLVFADTLGKTFRDLFDQVNSDVTIQPVDEVGSGEPVAGGRTVPENLVGKVAEIPGVHAAEGGSSARGSRSWARTARLWVRRTRRRSGPTGPTRRAFRRCD